MQNVQEFMYHFFHQDIIQDKQNIFQLMKLNFFQKSTFNCNFNFQMTNQGNDVKTEITIVVQQILILNL